MNTDQFTVRPYTLKELAAQYNCSVKTFRKWIRRLQKDIGPREGHVYTPRQVRVIVDQLGTP